jgi:general secretion pathway protein G
MKRTASTLLELLVIVIVLGVLAGVIIPRIGDSTNRARRDACKQYKAEINAALERYLFQEGHPPNALGDLKGNADYFSGPIPRCPVTGQAYSLDGTTHRVAGHDH